MEVSNIKMEFNSNYKQEEKIIECDQFVPEKSMQMTSSVASILDDTTPSDSGVQLLDSESSELNESMISSGVFEFDSTNDLKNSLLNEDKKPNDFMTKSDIVNSNISLPKADNNNDAKFEEIDISHQPNQIPDELISSTCSTFDTENIVYRRRIKKTNNNKAPKKRVSFHEDILKNTKTDNIHIEHGFITYKNNASRKPVQTGRYSWCSEYEKNDDDGYDYDNDDGGDNRQYVYRNACSEVLDYGKTDVFENLEDEKNYVKYDNSGIFEYGPNPKKGGGNNNELYKCGCSDSNSSLDSGSSNEATQNYKQSKSNSCECIGATQNNNNNNNNNIISDNCYYSEPNIEHMDEFNGNNVGNAVKSVWSKEKKPKSSCLKKTKRNIYTNIVPEYDLNKKVKKFNVHHLSVIDNSRMIFGSLKDIFGISLPERGVPEGSEDLTSVKECIPETNENMIDDFTVIQKPKSLLSKSLDGGFNSKNPNSGKKYVHNVDEQLRRKNDEDLYAPSRKNSLKIDVNDEDENENNLNQVIDSTNTKNQKNNYRNKYIINGESTVFEHTGVSYSFGAHPIGNLEQSEREFPIAETSNNSFMGKTQIKQKLSNIFKQITDIGSNASTPSSISIRSGGDGVDNTESQRPSPDTEKPPLLSPTTSETRSEISPNDKKNTKMETSTVSSCGSDHSSILSEPNGKTDYVKKLHTSALSPKNQNKNRHLSSPLRKKSLTTRLEKTRMSPDLFNLGARHINADLLQSKQLLCDEFDDILTITTTDTDKTMDSSDIVILDYPPITTPTSSDDSRSAEQFLKPPNMMTASSSSSTSKTSLINRFLRNVTQKKILDATIKKNMFFQTKLNNEKKLFENLYLKGVKPRNKELIEDLNAEIAMEIELSSSACQLDRIHLNEHPQPNELNIDIKFDGGGIGVGEISIDIFNGNHLHILRNENEILMKVFKLYNGYSREGYMTPVLVFLTDKTLYVTDNIRNRLCNKFVLPYSELDVILVGPYGNTVLLSNSARDMQQVLLAGGPYPADGLVSSLELCARRGGSVLPAVGQLTLDHLAPLQSFVRENSSVLPTDAWKYYAVVNVPASTLGGEQEPLGPHIRGPLMHRRLSHSGIVNNWAAGYFLLKAGVLYLFNDSTQKLPTWAVALAECQGARRSVNSGRPYCFELLLRTGALQLAAPDEYVASDWLQALVQAASGCNSQLFEMQERHRTLGCTLIVTSNNLLTLREDFSSPLRRVTTNTSSMILSPSKENINPNAMRKMSNSTILDTSSEVSSIRSNASTPTKMNDRRTNSTMSTPTKSIRYNSPYHAHDDKSYTNMTSFYGKNSGIEVLTCASIDEMIAVRIPVQSSYWWCILEFECQEVRENSDDLVVFFSTSSEQERFLTMLESLWHSKKEAPFPVNIISDDDIVHEQCSKLFNEINRSWEPLLTAALGFPQ